MLSECPFGHPIILLKSNKFNLATVSVKRSVKNCLMLPLPTPAFLSRKSMQSFQLVPVSHDTKYTHAQRGHVLLRHRAHQVILVFSEGKPF